MKYTSTLLLFLFLTVLLPARAVSLRGTVLDRTSGEPIPGVTVYFNGTTLGAITDTRGRYELNLQHVILVPLTFRHMGYDLHVETDPFTALPDSVFLTETLNRLETAMAVTAGSPLPFTRWQMMQFFHREFLGQSESGRLCTIKNEDAIRFWYNNRENTLYARADVPLQVHNRRLAYDIDYDLIEFRAVFREIPRTPLEGHIVRVQIAGSAHYTDLAPQSEEIAERRQEVYAYSGKQFFSLLARNRLDSMSHYRSPTRISGGGRSMVYRIIGGKDGVIGNWEKTWDQATGAYKAEVDTLGFTVTDLGSWTQLKLSREPCDIALPGFEEFTKRYARLTVDYLHRGRRPLGISTLDFVSDNYLIDRYGNITPALGVIISGRIGTKRIGEQLPDDYLPKAAETP